MEKEGYRAITLRCEPNRYERMLLNANLLAVTRLTEVSKIEFQKLLYHKFKDEKLDIASRVIDLMLQRSARTLMANKLLPIDDRIYKFKKENGAWFLDILLKKGRQGGKSERVLIPIYKSDCSYYGDILDEASYPGTIYKQGDDFFVCVTIPVAKNYEEARPTVYCGIDLNQRKHAATFLVPAPSKYDGTVFFDLEPIDKLLKKLQQEISDVQKGRRNNALTDEERALIKALYQKRDKIIEKGHGDFIRKLMAIADRYWAEGYNVVFNLEDLKGITRQATKSYAPFNRWLHSQWCYRKFGVMLETKKYPVEYVDARNTSRYCHICHTEGVINGKHKRMFNCPKCGLHDFSRDLNAARNIAAIAASRDLKQEDY